MHALDPEKFSKALKQSRIKSILELSRRVGLHRNTINHYLAGHSVYQAGYEKICTFLKKTPDDLVKKEKKSFLTPELAQFVDTLHHGFPHISFVLFGSRARSTFKKFSDWDIGFFSSQKISHADHLRLLRLKGEFLENSLEFIDLVNLNRADRDFLISCRNDLIFLTGSLSDWRNLQKRFKI